MDAHEHLDGPLDAAMLGGNLRDLARINRRLGGLALTRRAIGSLAPGGGTLRLERVDPRVGADWAMRRAATSSTCSGTSVAAASARPATSRLSEPRYR